MTRTIPLDRYRNIGILATPDAGRTTTTERLLAAAAREESAARGHVRASDAVPAWVEQDNERDITLTSAATSCVWRDCRINIVELPASTRMGEDGAFSVLDGAIVVIDGVAGVTEDVAAALARAEDRGVSRLVFVNKLDREGANLDAVVAALSARNGVPAVLLQLPIGAGAGLKGIVDLVGLQATVWTEAFDAPGQDGPVPAALVAAAQAARAKVVAAVAPGQDGIAPSVLRDKLREAVVTGRVVPVLCGSAFRNRGIRRLLDAVVDYLPEPMGSDEAPFAGLAFQTVDDPSAGKLTFVRIYSGVVATGGQMLNSVTTSPEKIGRMVRMHANHTEDIEEAHAGDIVALAGLTHTTSGDTLCDPAAPVILERLPASAGRVKH